MSGVIHHSEISDTVKRMHKVVINQAVHELVTAKLTGAKEKDMRKSYTKFMATFETMGAKITRPALHTRVCREYQKKLRLTMPVEEVEMEDTSNDVSSISSPDVSNAPELEEIEEEPLQPGNTKGNTKVKRQQDAKDYVDCMNEITYDYATKLAENRITKKRCKGGYLESLIQEKKLKYEVPDTISPETIRSRVRTGNLDPSHPGTQSPLHEAEQALVVICIQMGQIRQPLNCAEGIRLMNDMIAGTPTQDALKEFQMVRKLNRSQEFGTVGWQWWDAFMRRHGDKIVSKRGERFACIRGQWTKLSNIKTAYRCIYDEMVDARIASVREIPVFTDREGNEVEESEAFGFKQDIKIDHPDYLLFGDESGCSTNQKKDGHIAGTKFIVPTGTVPQILCSTNDHKFTILPFTSASGKAVCCVVIFKSETEEVPILWKTGMDITAENPAKNSKGKIDFQLNLGLSSPPLRVVVGVEEFDLYHLRLVGGVVPFSSNPMDLGRNVRDIQ